ncbi:MAG: hypothetical protein ACTSSI_01170 [Candidatus Helarchaeota archaeon]
MGMEFGLSSFLSALNGIPNPHEFRTKAMELIGRVLLTVMTTISLRKHLKY